MSKQLICSQCGHVGSSQTAVKGSFLIEIVLWLCFIVPGLIYSLWRSTSRYKKCPVCGSTNMIPVDSPVGQKLLADQGKSLEQVLTEKPVKTRSRKEKIMIGVVGVIGFFFITGLISAITSDGNRILFSLSNGVVRRNRAALSKRPVVTPSTSYLLLSMYCTSAF